MASLVSIEQSNIVTSLQQWRTVMNQFLSSPKSIAAPVNVAATPQEGSILISWAAVKDASGYEVHISQDGSFLDTLIVPQTSGDTTSFTDVVGAAPTTRFYKVLATTGSAISPNSVKSKLSPEVTTTSKVFSQVLSSSVSSGTTSSATVTAVSGLSVNITLKGNNNNISPTVLLTLTGSLELSSTTSFTGTGAVTFMRDGSALLGTSVAMGGSLQPGTASPGANIIFPIGLVVLDRPGSIGAHTYSIDWNTDGVSTLTIPTNFPLSLVVTQIV